MKGQILGYDQLKAEGVISGEDGQRYTFAGSDWKGVAAQLRNGAQVDFTANGTAANEIYPVPGTSGSTSDVLSGAEKSPIVAGLLAIFLGGIGVHKFYLGYNNEGIILIAATVVSWLTLIIGIGFLGLMGIGIVTLVEGIIYLTKSQDDFRATYVDNKKPWF